MKDFPRLLTPTSSQGQSKDYNLSPNSLTLPSCHPPSSCEWEDFQIQYCHFWFICLGDMAYELYYHIDPHGTSNPKSMASNDSPPTIIGQ